MTSSGVHKRAAPKLWTSWRRISRGGIQLSVARKLQVVGLMLVLLFALDTVGREQYLAWSERPLETYAELSLEDVQRLMVVAPHCDDEVLGTAGLIQAAVRRGLEVRVVIATNGDGHPFAAMENARRPVPQPQDYIALGERRQWESLNGLRRLGLAEEDVIFLGYPDRGLASLWWGYWTVDHPYRSPQTGRDASPYARTFQPGASYSGESLLSDLRAILAMYRPDVVVGPHPNDDNGDHRTLSAFLALALELEQAQEPDFDPQLFGYLVHYGLYPQPWGARLEQSLRPPRQLEALGDWLRWQLSLDETTLKLRAISDHRSQVQLRAKYLNGFARQNELFMRVHGAVAIGLIEGEVFLDADSAPVISGEEGMPAYDDPVSDSVVRRARGGADIAKLQVFRLGDSLWVGIDLKERVSREYTYQLYIRTITADGSEIWSGRYGRVSTPEATARGHTVWYRLDYDALRHPDWVAIAAETRQGVVLDRTAWYIIRLQEWPWEPSVGLEDAD
jgi:LmbE family N-acetylglucosaminyl deacetylase